MMRKTAWLGVAFALFATTSAALANEVTISPGDVVKVEVVGEAGLSANHTVTADGAISVPLAGRLVISGLTASGATTRLAEALREYLLDPQVSVSIVERAKLRVTIVGAVAKPGAASVPSGTRVAGLIAAAGGTLAQADPSAVRIVRAGGGEAVANLVALARGDVSQNLELAQGDLVIVPRLTLETGIRVVGEVKNPGLYPVGEEMRLWDVVGAAGGLTSTANGRDAVLTRAGGEKIPVDLTQLLTAESVASGIRVQRGDMLAVPGMTLQVYVLGAVRTPGPFLMAKGATLLDAIAQAGGVTPTARLRDAYLLRKDPEQGSTSIPLRVDLLLRKGDMSKDVALQNGDKIVIPESGPRKPSFMEKAQPYILPLLYMFAL